ncbi:TIGR03750 family conjugal transfer protein [Mergibacter septicus]|uniref:TIGR03750 family conjugal transfer protein n=1 Tax=Mergibacter septicus TaxID=221402 RepID=A0A8D4J129_9PAST|nr:TIGR03750 family conjugal transfer protein [Mergibacter septicus]AWX14715.1 TIGR03750 family conjugal transfer protein [Mergibacter septicus]QDJ13966.1 TIGR03750 family conjugal transfer protein [Mergibacter septicus]UTU48584.1 TIGR03750 family conjugal transfer protein [Mergibacter septicus]WMR95786.1 TIGR03750 family conjugal transfer protein [Mergibacter septicus]
MTNNTIPFIPERLNRQPVVFRGMTISELLIVFGIGAIVGLVMGILLILLLGDWAIIPTCIAIFAFLFLFWGGSIISRVKRGKSDTWLPRFLEFKFYQYRFFSVINASTYYSIRRERQIK